MITPQAFAGYAKNLYVPDTDGKYADNKYKLQVRLPKGSDEVEAFVKKLTDMHDDANFGPNTPVKDGDALESDNIKAIEFGRGHYLMTFKSKRLPTFVDSQKQPMVEQIDGGDMVKIAFNMVPYEAFGGGHALYLNAVQLIQKGGNGGAEEFGTEDGYVTVGEKLPTADPVNANF
jgi:hypothetical protein